MLMKQILPCLLLFLLTACQVVWGVEDKTDGSSPTISKTVFYAVAQNITLVNDGPMKPEKHNLWVALIGDHMPYQEVVSSDIQPSNYAIITDEFGNQYAEFDLQNLEPGTSAQIVISYEIAVNELAFSLVDCEGELPDEYNQPELHIESHNPQIVSLAEDISSTDQTVCARVRAFYDYIGDNLTYTYNGNDWGAQAALGKMGADCTEYSSLLIALSRASGIPARYVEGLLYFQEGDTNETRQEHAWVELFFPGSGWTPIDPTLGRLTLTREQHFARYSPNHIVITKGRNPSTLRGASYWSHLYWPGDSTNIHVQDAAWTITPLKNTKNP